MHKDGIPVFHRQYGYIPFSNEGNPQMFTGFCSALFSFIEGLILGSSKIESVRLTNMSIHYSTSKSFVFVLISGKFSSELKINYAMNLIKGKFLNHFGDNFEAQEIAQIDDDFFKSFSDVVDAIARRIEFEEAGINKLDREQETSFVNEVFEKMKAGTLALEKGQEQIVSYISKSSENRSWLSEEVSTSWLENEALSSSISPKFREPLPRLNFSRRLIKNQPMDIPNSAKEEQLEGDIE